MHSMCWASNHALQVFFPETYFDKLSKGISHHAVFSPLCCTDADFVLTLPVLQRKEFKELLTISLLVTTTLRLRKWKGIREVPA